MSVGSSALNVERSGAAGRAVFLSYASQDAEAAKRICDALRAAGVEVWFDAEGGLEHGDEWDAKIRRQIKECVLFLPIISANTQAREEGYFRIEWELAAQRALGIASGVAFILPIVVDDTREPDALVPDRFRTVQWTRLPGGEVLEDVKERFVKLWSHRTGALKQASRETDDSDQKTQEAEPGTKNRGLWIATAIGAIALLVLGTALYRNTQRNAVERRFLEGTVPEIEKRAVARDFSGAFALAAQAELERPGDPALQKLWPLISVQAAIETVPAGADVYVKAYNQPGAEWRHLGQAPLKDVRLPRVYMRWKIQKDGHAPLERAAGASVINRFQLDPVAAIPREMIRVPGGGLDQNQSGFPSVRLPEFLIDRHEVTNRQFKTFVDAGGYTNPDYWKQPFVHDGRTLSREEALARFRDATGRPGPANWRNGTFADGQADLPVTGVSWFEAVAYAVWASKRLPSVYHWRAAARLAAAESCVPLSNFSSKGLVPGGAYQGMSAFGAYDMAGNAKEWCWNAAGTETRYILGGAWREPDYMFAQTDALSAFDRGDGNGFRCMRPVDAEPEAPQIAAMVAPKVRDYAKEQPVSDETFEVFRSLYLYDKGPLDARTEGVDDTDPRWRRETVSYRAAYGEERITAHLFLPKNATPPFQVIVFFPNAGSIGAVSSETVRENGTVAVFVASGRALIYPIYKGTYERQTPGLTMEATWVDRSASFRDWTIMLSKDLGRSIDYLETRPDIQADKLAYVGASWGGASGALLPAVEKRFKASVLIIGGFYEFRVLPEADQLNFTPRNTVPTLMLGGRYDFRFPLETSQRPMFKWLGAPPEHKKHVLFDTGHALKTEQIAGEAYTWLDRYLGPVK